MAHKAAVALQVDSVQQAQAHVRCADLEHSNQQACRQQKFAVFVNQANTQTHRVFRSVQISAAPRIQNRGCQSLTTGWCQPTTVTAITAFGSRAIHHQFALNVKRLNGVRVGSVTKAAGTAIKLLPARTANPATSGHLACVHRAQQVKLLPLCSSLQLFYSRC